MVVQESDMMSHDEVESPLRRDQQTKINSFSSLPRQSSIYSLTLDAFQHTLCESGRNFGSMNMDEFLSSIWTAEENQAHEQAQGQTHVTSNNNDYNPTPHFPVDGLNSTRSITNQVSLSRQGSLTLPAPLCRKTVDEVWSEIHRTRREQERQEQQNQSNSGGGGRSSGKNNNNMQDQGSAQTQPTFGEMTLEDFLVKAGVVHEQCNAPPPAQPPPYGMFRQLSPPAIGTSFGPRPMVGNIPPYQPLAQNTQHAEPMVYKGNRGGTGGYPTGPPVPAVNYMYGSRGAPVSPQSDGMGVGGQVDGSNQYDMDMNGMRGGRKRILDGPVEKVVERRQRRMIKNRESAARSRARKQAYTVELEAELNQLKDENAQLKHALADLERKRKQQYFEDAKMKAQTKAQKTKERIQIMRRSFSCPV